LPDLNSTKSKQITRKPHPAFSSKTKFHFTVAASATWLLPHISAHAQTFAYTNCDLVAAFRIAGGANDLVVDLEQASNFENLPARSVTTLANLSATQLTNAQPDNLRLAVFFYRPSP